MFMSNIHRNIQVNAILICRSKNAHDVNLKFIRPFLYQYHIQKFNVLHWHMPPTILRCVIVILLIFIFTLLIINQCKERAYHSILMLCLWEHYIVSKNCVWLVLRLLYYNHILQEYVDFATEHRIKHSSLLTYSPNTINLLEFVVISVFESLVDRSIIG